MAPRGATGCHTMQQGFDPPRAFPTGICEISSWPQTNSLVTLSRLPDSEEAAYRRANNADVSKKFRCVAPGCAIG